MSEHESFLNSRTRAEDIILGALGFDCDAKVTLVELTPEGYRGRGQWSSGEEFEFKSEDEPSELERWAIAILRGEIDS